MTAEKMIQSKRLGEHLYVKQLASGLTVYVMPKRHFAKKYVYFAVPYGGFTSTFEAGGHTYEMPKGMAHFLEHQIFENPENPTFQQFEKIGANVNAFTSYQMTAYHFETVGDIEQPLEILMDMVLHARIDERSVAKEKKVIVQEIQMYDDDPYFEVGQLVRQHMYHAHPIKDDIAGTVASVEETTLEQLKMCYNTFYTPHNMSLFVYGDVDRARVYELAERFQTEGFLAKNGKATALLPEEPYAVKTKQIDIVRRVGQDKVLLGFKARPIADSLVKMKRLAAIRMANSMMFGDSSHFFETVYNAGLIHEPVDFDVQSGKGFAHCIIGADTDETLALEEAVLSTIAQYKVSGFSDDDFQRMKKKLIGRFIFSFNSLQSVAGNVTFNKMRGDDLFKQLEAYNTLTLEDLKEALHWFYDEQNYTRARLLKEA